MKFQAILRRTYYLTEESLEVMRFNGVVIDYARIEVTYNRQLVSLTKNELFILRLLVGKVDHIFFRDDLMRHLWNDERFVSDNTLPVNVNRLRMKLETIGLRDVIVTKKALGDIVDTLGV